MNRRRFISLSMMLGGGAVAAYYGHKFVKLNDTPNLVYLQQHQQTIAELADLIIPRTNTPGAKDAKVQDYIIFQLTKQSSKKTCNNFIEGLDSIMRNGFENYNKPFIELNKNQQASLLKHYENDARSTNEKIKKIKQKIFGKPFFVTLKELTTVGYCTSLEGSTKGLAYAAIPGKYLAVTGYQSGQLSWATK